jgi:hypothetical protein
LEKVLKIFLFSPGTEIFYELSVVARQNALIPYGPVNAVERITSSWLVKPGFNGLNMPNGGLVLVAGHGESAKTYAHLNEYFKDTRYRTEDNFMQYQREGAGGVMQQRFDDVEIGLMEIAINAAAAPNPGNFAFVAQNTVQEANV